MHESAKQQRPLTICVPTYNRPNEFARLIRQLLTPEITSFSNILVANNASTETYDWSILLGHPTVDLVHRQFNIGTTGNFTRLFEEVTTEWMMIIGDDDQIEPGFADILKSELGNDHSGVAAVKFSSNLFAAEKRLKVKTIGEFIRQIEDPKCFGNTLFCSTWLIRREAFVEHIRMSYVYASFHGPHFIPLLFILHSKKGSYIQSTEMPVRWESGNPESLWSYGHTYAAMLSTLPLLPIFESKEQIRTMARSIVTTYDRYHAIRFGLWLIYCFPTTADQIAGYVCGLIGFKYKIGFIFARLLQKFSSHNRIRQIYGIGADNIDRL
jgi:glycosyltransferase involved in cell wall biosynthesis